MAGSHAKAKGKAAAQKAPARPKLQKARSSALIDVHDHDDIEESLSKTKSLRRRGSDEIVEKAIRDNFAGWSQTETHVNKVEGKTIFQHIQDAKREKKVGNDIKLGKLYYSILRKKFETPDAPAQRLDALVTDDTEDIDQSLVDGLMGLVRVKRSIELFLSWTETTEAVNQLCLVAAFKQLLKLPPQRTHENASLTIAVLRMIKRLGLHTKHTDEMSVMQEHFDSAAVKNFSCFKARGLGASQWWAANKDWAGLVLPSAEVDKCLAEEGCWSNVQKELHAVAMSSDIGHRLFSRALQQVELDEISDIVDRSIAALGNKITPSIVAMTKKKFVNELNLVGVDATKPFDKVKEVDIQYRGLPTLVVTCSPHRPAHCQAGGSHPRYCSREWRVGPTLVRERVGGAEQGHCNCGARVYPRFRDSSQKRHGPAQ